MSQSFDPIERLKSMLAWKAGEQPYPGYFEDFNAQLLRQLRWETAAKSPWWERWMAAFDVRPVMATAYALLIGGMLLFGFGFSQIQETTPRIVPVHANHGPILGTLVEPPVAGLDPWSAPASLNTVITNPATGAPQEISINELLIPGADGWSSAPAGWGIVQLSFSP